MQKKRVYKVIDLARMFDMHPNSVRLYEKLGFISQAQRSKNNYRIFEELHLLQIKACRCIFGYPFTNKRIRNAGNEIMWAIAKNQWDTAKDLTDGYIKLIEQELAKAHNAAEMLLDWSNLTIKKRRPFEMKMLSRKQVANYLGVTVETIRNWERNSLITSCDIGLKGETLYSSDDLDRMYVIFMLLQAGYSIASIHRSLSRLDKGCAELVTTALDNPKQDDLISVGDRWIFELNKLLTAAQELPLIIEEMENI